MSAHITIKELYDVVVNNDVPGLERAILLLGERIRSIKLWCDFPAVMFAAKLGHLEQVQVLLEEILRYPDSCYRHHYKDSSLSFEKIYIEVLRHRWANPELTIKLIEDKKWMVLRLVYEHSDFEFLEKYVLKDDYSKGKYVDMIIDVVLDCSTPTKLTSTAPDWIKESVLFTERANSLRQTQPLIHALKFGHVEEVKHLFEHHQQPNLYYERLLMKSDDEEIQRIATSASKFPRLMEMVTIGNTAFRTENQFFVHLLNRASACGSTSMLRVLLSHERLKRFPLLRHKLYFELLLSGKLQLAEMVKDNIGSMDKKLSLKTLCDILTNTGAGNLIEQLRFLPKNDLLESIGALESLVGDCPKLRIGIEQRLRSFPMENRRPDLVEPFGRFGVDYSVHDVLSHDNDRKLLKPMFGVMAYDFLSGSCEWPEFHKLGFGIHAAQRALNTIFLGRDSAEIGIGREQIMNRKFCNFLEECVTQSSRKVVLVLPLDTDAYWKGFFEGIETRRRMSMSLLKLCRLAMRSALGAGGDKNLDDSILSLYLDGKIPIQMAKYLLYRSTNRAGAIGPRPLYYSLFAHRAMLECSM